ncbi:DivIVA domain-containing protein [Micromonospora sp. NPDC049523]|uniref:DivIVA domain-containing protein n=1 Tax=Micromonospora sp. NPDC049523 TaxID=3155921 RepID=UPI00342E0CA7
MSNDPLFVRAMRGYDVGQVDAVVRRVRAALESDSEVQRALARDEIRQVSFSVGLRGYDRSQVNDYLARASALLA